MPGALDPIKPEERKEPVPLGKIFLNWIYIKIMAISLIREWRSW